MSNDAELLAYKLATCLGTFLKAPDAKMRDICEQALGEYYHYLRGGTYINPSGLPQPGGDFMDISG